MSEPHSPVEGDLYRILTDFAVFGLISRDDKVVKVAPISGWAHGRSTRAVLQYWRKRGAIIEKL